MKGIIKELKKKGFEIKIIYKNIYLAKFGKKSILFKCADCGLNNSFGFKIAKNKDLTYALLKHSKIPYPKSVLIGKDEKIDFKKIESDLSYPLVVKPFDGIHGKGISTFLNCRADLKKALVMAFKHSKKVIVQRFIKGDDHRILVLDGKFYAGAKRTQAMVVGDGINTIKKLTEIENQNPLRGGNGHDKILVKIVLDKITDDYLKRRYKDTIESIPKKGEEIFLKPVANITAGGFLEDVTASIGEDLKKKAEKIANLTGLKIVGIDILTTDPSKTLQETGGAVIEINSDPALYFHDGELTGASWLGSYNVFEKIVEMVKEKYF